MEENQLTQISAVEKAEPVVNTDNSALQKEQNSEQKPNEKTEGKSNDSSKLILGKFKSTEDLTEAYKQLEKLQGNQSSELGALREKVASINMGNEALKLMQNLYENREQIQATVNKYPEYFADPSFKQLYTEAYLALKNDLDVDRLVNLVESYASARIFAYEKSKSANAETQQVTNGMKFDKNDKTVSTPVKKSIQQMTPKELDELLEKMI